jgi:tRNA dimethylallyltransferase
VCIAAIFGPTASGKSAVAEHLADMLGTEIVSADAMQVYRGLPILTNQPARPTRLVGIQALDEEMSVGAFAPLAHAALDDVVGSHGVAILAGGTGLYFRAALAMLAVPPRVAEETRARIASEVEADPEVAFARLRHHDPRAAEVVHPNDRKRVIRALELAETGRSLVPAPDGPDGLWGAGTRLPTLIFGLDIPASVLEERIRIRTAEMFRRGVVGEVRAVDLERTSRTAAKTLGLAEIMELEPPAAEERIVLRTRRYAAYQRKWMRRIPGVHLLDGTRPPPAIAEEIALRLPKRC